MKKKRYHIRFSGQVQNVGFRYTATHLAERYGLIGWVYNEYDGSVISEVQGDTDSIEEWIHMIDASKYEKIIEEYRERLKGYTHKDQKPFGISGRCAAYKIKGLSDADNRIEI